MASTSGTTTFNPALSDLVLEAFSRIQVRPASLGPNHLADARISAQLLQSEWSNTVPNLWLVDQQSIALEQGVATYAIPPTTITLLDAFQRQYELIGPTSYTPNFSTVINTPTVTLVIANNGMVPGNWIQVYVPVAVGGLLIQNFYQVATVVDPNTFTITAASNATGTVNHGGVVPVFTGTVNSTTITVVLPNHGLYVNQNFTIQVSTTVGGVPLQGVYPVATVIDANTFTFLAPYACGANQTISENGGQTQISLQSSTMPPLDRVMFSMSRTDYNNQPNKSLQAFPTTYWYDRTVNPTITFWPVPDANGPYQFFYYRMFQPQDAVLANGTLVQLPYRFFDAFAAGLAARLARKYAPQLAAELKAEAMDAFQKARDQDVEYSPMFIAPGLGSYFR